MADALSLRKDEPGLTADPARPERPVFELFEGFALANVLASLERAGLLEQLEREGGVPVDADADVHDLLQASLRYLAQRDIAQESDGAFVLTDAGREICRDKGYLVWLQGGYGHVLGDLGSLVAGTKTYGDGADLVRDGRWVADGSALIGREDVAPHAMSVLEGIRFSHAVDLGCGNARFLIAAAQKFGVTGLGIDLAPEAVEDAEIAIRSADLANQVRVRCGDAGDLGAIPELAEADLAVAFFLLHEIFEHGMDALMGYLRTLGSMMPTGAHMLVAEVQPATGAARERWRPEFTLLHHVMGQELLDEAGWHDAFTEAGWARHEVRELGLPGAILLLYENVAPERGERGA